MRGHNLVHQYQHDLNAIYRYGNTWLGWAGRANCVPGPIDADRLYITRETASPQVYMGATLEPLAFDRVATRPSVTLSGTVDDDTAETVMYAYTIVSIYGEETAPSNLSLPRKFSEGTQITVSDMPGSTVQNGRMILHKRLYRSQTSAAGVTDLYYIATVPVLDTTFVDVFGENPIAEPCPTKDFLPAPNDLRGLTGMANGIMAGFRGKEILFCEPYQPHAWPDGYRLVCDYSIVGLCAVGTSLIVLTKGAPYIIQGLHPDSMAMQKVESILPCLTPDSIVDMGAYAIYASNEGLVQISEGGAQLITRDLWAKDDWQALANAEYFAAGRYGDAYIFSTWDANPSRRFTFIVNVTGDQPSLVRCTELYRLFWNNPTNNFTFCVPQSDTDAIYRFDAPSGDTLQAIWRSKPFRYTAPVNYSAGLVEAGAASTPHRPSGTIDLIAIDEFTATLDDLTFTNDGPYRINATIPDELILWENEFRVSVQTEEGSWGGAEGSEIRFYGDGNLIYTKTGGANTPFRLPAGRYREWQIEIRSTVEIIRVAIGQSLSEVWR